MAVTKIACADDLAALAKETLDHVWTDKRFSDLIGAILMANHVADWHFQVDLKRKFEKAEKQAMNDAYPEWETIRQLANGTKHCKLISAVQPKQEDLQWEHDDFWGSPGHVGGDGIDWFVDHDGKQRSAAVLIRTFLEKFDNSSARPT
ncbi:hypothetical protein [Noviherbaspirillum saxi]|uniref:Uncharacterized protein n=1 Tax=Noviherbaspirillum saxi TaxID=2320863 RepID=A0A3A3G3M7_9BURK|nr:hypothetical protein [Noviherbaspirillum saxi]RJF92673.1 hypothetical protein D3871_29265 [Noviherbaspirillum saxi]